LTNASRSPALNAGMSSPSDLRLDWCGQKAAKYAVEKWHYSKTLPRGVNTYLGVWESGDFIGAVVFGLGGGGATDGRRFGLARTYEMCELVRVALSAHTAPVSRIVKVALGMLKRRNPGIRLVVSYADPVQDHVGAIYQAGNWAYVGTSAPDHYFVSEDGKRYHSRSVHACGYAIHFGRKTYTPKPEEMTMVKTPGKHKYLMPLDDAMRAQIEPLRKPYPKRVKQATTGVQSASGGAAPTHTLHTSPVSP
jgi:hypothetical protein